MQDAVAALAKSTGMRIPARTRKGFTTRRNVSPPPSARPWTSSGRAAPDRHRRRIGIVAQSGGIGFAIYNRARPGYRTQLCDLDWQRVRSRRRRVLRLHGAGFFDRRDPAVHRGHSRHRKIPCRGAPRCEIGKPSSLQGRPLRRGERAAASHTASMAGWTRPTTPCSPNTALLSPMISRSRHHRSVAHHLATAKGTASPW